MKCALYLYNHETQSIEIEFVTSNIDKFKKTYWTILEDELHNNIKDESTLLQKIDWWENNNMSLPSFLDYNNMFLYNTTKNRYEFNLTDDMRHKIFYYTKDINFCKLLSLIHTNIMDPSKIPSKTLHISYVHCNYEYLPDMRKPFYL